MTEQPDWRPPLEPVREDPPQVQQYPYYGYPPPYVAAPPPQRTNGMATASMILGIVGLVFGWFIFAIPSIVAVVFGHVALGQIARDPNQSGKGMAIAGLVTGYIVIGLVALFWVFFTIGVATSA